MDTTVTEKNYPIRLQWVLRFFGLVVLIGLPFILLSRIGVNLGPHPRLLAWLVVIAGLFPVMNALLWRAAFHYSLGGQCLIVRQGILSTQERSVPYGVIQNLSIDQDFFDRIFGLATLTIEDVSQDRGDVEAASRSLLALPFMSRMGRVYAASPQARAPQLGFYGNQVRIAGLSVSDAETLQEMFLQKKTVSVRRSAVDSLHKGAS
jgi:membrane protein YdbS with pleckstrin-like domain